MEAPSKDWTVTCGLDIINCITIGWFLQCFCIKSEYICRLIQVTVLNISEDFKIHTFFFSQQIGWKKNYQEGIMAKKRNFSVIEFPCLEGGRNFFFKSKKKKL